MTSNAVKTGIISGSFQRWDPSLEKVKGPRCCWYRITGKNYRSLVRFGVTFGLWNHHLGRYCKLTSCHRHWTLIYLITFKVCYILADYSKGSCQSAGKKVPSGSLNYADAGLSSVKDWNELELKPLFLCSGKNPSNLNKFLCLRHRTSRLKHSGETMSLSASLQFFEEIHILSYIRIVDFFTWKGFNNLTWYKTTFENDFIYYCVFL